LERIGEEDPVEEQLFWDLWEDEGERETVLEALKADCEVRADLQGNLTNSLIQPSAEYSSYIFGQAGTKGGG
jgi:hypothetical protein